VRNGVKVLFWRDKWCREQYLKVQFSNLFRMATLRNATAQEVLSWNGGQYHWDITFTRSLNEWEEEIILRLLTLLAYSDVVVQSEGNDKRRWSRDPNGTFFVKSLCNRLHGSSCSNFLAKAIWKLKAPTKASCFLALAASKGKVATKVMLKRRNFNLASRSAVCLEEEDSVDHLFLHCQWVSSLWFLALSLMRVS